MVGFPSSFNVKSLFSNTITGFGGGIIGRSDITNGAAGNLLSSSATKSLDPRGNQIAPITGAREALKGLGGELTRGLDPRGNQIAPIVTSAGGATPEPQVDRRLRIKAKRKETANLVYGPQSPTNILSVFHTTNGVVFPYTPILNVAHTADWSPIQLTHTNYQTQTYARSYIQNITISAQFTAQNEQEAFYSFAAAHFFKTVTKMHYGKDDPLAGATPPVLNLTGYGNGVFNDLPVVVTGFSQEYSDQVDMVKVQFDGGKGSAWVPTVTMLIIDLAITHDMRRVRDEFNLAQFGSGQLLTNNKGFV